MAKTEKKALTTKSVFDSILSTTKEVQLGEHTITLHAPSVPEVSAIHLAPAIPQEATAEQKFDESLNRTAMAVRACLKDPIDMDTIKHVLMMTGGLSSPLGKAAFSLCGFDQLSEEAEKITDRPTE